MRGLRTIICVTALFSSSCTSGSVDTCSLDQFFCTPPERWQDEAQQLGTDRVLDLHVKIFDNLRPANDQFLVVLGDRGRESVVAMLDHLASSRRHVDHLFYEPIVRYVEERSSYRFCDSEERVRLENLVRGTGSSLQDENIERLEELCPRARSGERPA